MAGKILADTFQGTDSTETVSGASVTIPTSVASKYVVNGTLKAWAGTLDSTGATINNSLNVSSKTDESGAGVFTYALINAAAEQMDASALSALGGGAARFIRIASNATTTTNFQLVSVSSSGSNENGSHNWMFAGELA
jgi:hypothetical protein